MGRSLPRPPYPLYGQRRGDLLYMIETGLLEQLRIDEDGSEKSVEDYNEQVTRALFLIVSELTERRIAERAA
jgi:hypothetical protein